MSLFRSLALVGVFVGSGSEAAAGGLLNRQSDQLASVNARLHGVVLDYTQNHGADRRICSPALGAKRDVYVYLPPGFDPVRPYPALLFLHGFTQDETTFFEIVGAFDRAMACGEMPPFIVAAPDGSIRGRPTLADAGSFYLNSRAGRFEDYIVCDVWQFLTRHFPIRPEREFHMLSGASMGGFGAYNLGFKHPQQFKILVGIVPPLNLRYENCRGRYFANFDPACTAYRERLQPFQPIARFACGLTIREGKLTLPLFGLDRDAISRIAAENPVEMLAARDIRPGQYDMFIGYARRDEFNVDAQVESFLHVARQRCLEVRVAYDPNGRHDVQTGLRLFPEFVRWVGPLLRGYEAAFDAPPAAADAGGLTQDKNVISK